MPIDPACDCGACCAECGHDEGCSIHDGPLPVMSEAELRARAEKNPGTFLAFLLGAPEGGAA